MSSDFTGMPRGYALFLSCGRVAAPFGPVLEHEPKHEQHGPEHYGGDPRNKKVISHDPEDSPANAPACRYTHEAAHPPRYGHPFNQVIPPLLAGHGWILRYCPPVIRRC